MQSIITTILSQDLVQALVHTLLHSLWQAPLIALIMYVALRRLPQTDSHRRHNIALASIILLCACSIFTILYYIIDASAMMTIGSSGSLSTSTVPLDDIANQGLAPAATSASTDLMSWISVHQYRIAISWIAGVVLFSSRILLGGWHMRYIRQSISYDIDDKISDGLQRMSRDLGITKAVKIGVSTLVKTPMMMRHLKPIIILPIAAINQLSTAEVESIIAHELGHVMRNDFVKNIFILLAESLYFFNPAIWWMCSIIRSERENASDDIALQLGIDPYRYAKTLVRLEELQQPAQSGLALHINGTKNSLLNRVKRILEQPIQQSFVWERGAAMLLLMVSLVTVTTASHTMKNKSWISPLSHKQIEPIEVDAPEIKLSAMPAVSHISEGTPEEIAESLAMIDTIPGRDQRRAKKEIKKMKREMERASRSWDENLRNLKYKIRENNDYDDLTDEKKEEIKEEIEKAMIEFKEEMENINLEEIHEELNEAMRVVHEESANIHIDINEDLIEVQEEMHDLSHVLSEEMAEFGITLGSEMAELGAVLGKEMADIFKNIDLDDREDRRYWRSDRADRRDRGDHSHRRSHDAAKRALVGQMNSDNLWHGDENTLSITDSELIINGKRQSSAQHNKYLDLLARHIPEIKDGSTSISLTVKGASLDDAKSVSFSISIDD